MNPLAPEQIRVGRRLGLLVGLYLCGQLVAFGSSIPLVAAVFGTGITSWPEGDRLLFEPGGAMLLELVWSRPAAWIGALAGTGLLILFGAGLLSLPLAALMVGLCHGGRVHGSQLGARSVEHFVPFFLVTAATRLVQVLVGLGSVVAARTLTVLLGRQSDGASIQACVVLLTLLVLLVPGVLGDLIRAIVVRYRVCLRDALGPTRVLCRTQARALLQAYSARAGAALVLMLLAAWMAGQLEVERPESWRTWLVLVIHQTTAFGVAYLRASWLGRLLSLVPWPRSCPEPGQD